MLEEALVGFIHTAAEETFAVMLDLPVTPSATQPENLEEVSVVERIVTLIAITGDYNGTGVTTCSPALARRISSRMFMAEYPEVNREVLDAMAEISNMIFGNVKTMLEEQVGELGLSTPMVIFGRGFCMRSISQQWISLSLQVEDEVLTLQMCLAQNRNSARSTKNLAPASVLV
jgi:chemotaxis protein CheX